MTAHPTIAVIAPCRASARALHERLRHLAEPRAHRLPDGSLAVVVRNGSAATLDAVLHAVDDWLVHAGVERTRLYFGPSEFRITAPPAAAAA